MPWLSGLVGLAMAGLVLFCADLLLIGLLLDELACAFTFLCCISQCYCFPGCIGKRSYLL